MINEQTNPLDGIFAALSDPKRRALLARLAAQDGLTVGELAGPLPISMPAVTRHLDVLEGAGLVSREKQGRRVLCHLRPAPLRAVRDWLTDYETFWTEGLDRLAALLEAKP
ncbi:transcriptional regulator [Rhodovarius crocodyli]|uniref:Transcriptional regulator n=1 Tax=Rhodovarius crocodyli TaxID=1979269 RepID=A0A437M1D2_9PROT|nr:metalloregulator ArsR/SmtB family transcription factor [Rhodovarius crocodyli]RVT91520.1 transcriptional regulator [Rhodovarius crocodyli]